MGYEHTPENRYGARNKLIYGVPVAAIFFDVVVATTTLKLIMDQIAGIVNVNYLVPIIATLLVIVDMILGTMRNENVLANVFGFIFILVVPFFGFSEGFAEIQANEWNY